MIPIKILGESGYEAAQLGLSLSYNADLDKMPARMDKLAFKQGGHNGFLELIQVWMDVTAPRFWWQQADRYRLSSKMSESTMHTLLNRPLMQLDFNERIPATWLLGLNQLVLEKDVEMLKNYLPEGFLQRRVWMCSYKTLQNIVAQRKNHKLPEWQEFCDMLKEQLAHPEFVFKPECVENDTEFPRTSDDRV